LPLPKVGRNYYFAHQIVLLNNQVFCSILSTIASWVPFLGDYIAISPLNLSKEEEALIAYTTLVNNRHTYVVVKRIKF